MKSEKVAFSIGIIAIAVCILGNIIMAMMNANGPDDGGEPTEPQQVETERIEKMVKTIPFETETVDDDTVEYGKTAVKTKGVGGEKTYTYSAIYKGKVRLSRELIKEEITKQPVTEIIVKGTKIVWTCKDATSYDGNPNNDNLCTSSTDKQRYVGDCAAVALDPDYHPSQKGPSYYNGCPNY